MGNCKREKKGQGLVEYALLLTLVAIVVISVLTLMGPQIGNVFSQITGSLGGTTTESQDGPTLATVVDATATAGENRITVSITLSEDATITIRDQETGLSETAFCNTPCVIEIIDEDLEDAGIVEIIAPGGTVTRPYSDD